MPPAEGGGMEIIMKDDENMVTVWTAKEAVVMEAIERDRVNYFKKE